MGKKVFTDELDVALARPDADLMCRDIDAYADYVSDGEGEWPDEYADIFGEIISSAHDDPDKALAYIALAVSRTDHPGFLGLIGCGLLEDILRNPSDEMLVRIVAEASKSARFRWLLSHPFKVAVSAKAWEEIEKFRITGPHEEPSADTLPPRE